MPRTRNADPGRRTRNVDPIVARERARKAGLAANTTETLVRRLGPRLDHEATPELLDQLQRYITFNRARLEAEGGAPE